VEIKTTKIYDERIEKIAEKFRRFCREAGGDYLLGKEYGAYKIKCEFPERKKIGFEMKKDEGISIWTAEPTEKTRQVVFSSSELPKEGASVESFGGVMFNLKGMVEFPSWEGRVRFFGFMKGIILRVDEDFEYLNIDVGD